jgi:hypothetical protein
LAAGIYWTVLARRRRVGWVFLLTCGGLACLAAALAAVAMHAVIVLPQLSRAVAAHRSFATLAREGWIPESADETQRDFTANCSDRIADIVQGSREGRDGLERYRTLLRPAETLPPNEKDGELYGTVIQKRAKDLSELYAVESGFGKSERRALSWNDVTAQNGRFEAAAARNGGWWVHSSAYPAAVLMIVLGIPAVAWVALFLLSRRVSATVARIIRKGGARTERPLNPQGV